MKKISIFLLAAMAMVSCGNSYKAKDVKLNDENDSLNYAVGLINGLQIKQYYLAKDSSEEAITEFIDALENAYLDKDEVLSDIAQTGRQFGSSVSMFEKEGLAGNAAWTYNGESFILPPRCHQRPLLGYFRHGREHSRELYHGEILNHEDRRRTCWRSGYRQVSYQGEKD